MKMKTTSTKLIIVLFLITGINTLFAQDKYGAEPDKCKMNISLFHESVKGKNYAEALEPWNWVYKNCPKASKHIYSDGLKIALDKVKKGDTNAIDLVNEIYTKRIEVFPSNLGKVYSDWATFLKNNGGSDDEVFSKLELAFKAEPAKMSGKNIKSYFTSIIAKYKDTNAQKVFDTYDEVLDVYNTKIAINTKNYTKLQTKIKNGETLSAKEQKRVDKKQYETNLGIYGRDLLRFDHMVEKLATCDRLIPLYKKSYEKNKSNVVWLKRTANRLNKKGCKSDPFFVTLIENWAEADPTNVDVLKYLESIYRSQGRISEADTIAKKIFDMGSPQDKAEFVYSQAQDLFKNGKYSQARAKAREALKYDASFGKADILIARMYAKSANNCGKTEFEKRMAYVAAANKINQAIRIDPSLSSLGKRYLKSYRASFPDKTLIFNLGKNSGDSHTVKCWIGETVRIP